MSKILLVEDNPHIMKINFETLTMKGFEVVKAASAKECMECMQWNNIDLVVLDIMLPDGNGITLCKELKEKYSVPVLFLSALGESRDIVEGLRAGGDDYLTKPYDLDVLVARIEARLRNKEQVNRYLNYGPLKLDLLWGCGYLNNNDMMLTSREFSVLLMLTRNYENVISTEDIANKLWNDNSDASIKALWTLISRLRKKLQSDKTRLEITAVRGMGYKLEQI